MTIPLLAPDAAEKLEKIKAEDPAYHAELLEALAELDKINETNKLQLFRPHPKQGTFLKSHDRVKAFLGGNRSGKTTCGIVDDLIQAVDEECLPNHLRAYKKWQPPFHCRIVTPDFTSTMEGVVFEKLREWAPRHQLFGGKWDKAYDKQLRKLRFQNGSWFDFMTFEQDLDKFGGAALHRCLSEDTRILKRGGWAGPDDVDVDDEILTLNTTTGRYEWKPVNRVFTLPADRMYRLKSRNNFDALVTDDHRWWVYNKKTGRSYFTTTEQLKKSEQLIVGSSVGPSEAVEETWADEVVALVGWLVTDGWVAKSNMAIGQSVTANAAKCGQIEALLSAYEHSRYEAPYGDAGGVMLNYGIKGELRKTLLSIVGVEKELPIEFIDSLSARQREILLHALIDGDGMWYSTGRWSLTSSNPQHQEAIVYLATLCGWRVSVRSTQHSWSVILAKCRGERYDYNRVSVDSLEITEEDYGGRVWCPSTDNDTVVAFRNGATFVTGNCHYDEEPPEQIRKECRMRLIDHGGDELFTMTPLQGMSWMFDEVWERRYEEGITAVQVDMDDNPHLDPETKEVVLQGLTDEERKARKEGIFVHFAGLVYPEFGERHIVPRTTKRHLEGQSIVEAIDPGLNFAGACWIAFDKENRALVFDEIFLKNTPNLEYLAQAIKHKRAEWGITPSYSVIDPSARNRQQTVEAEKMEAELGRFGIHCIHGQNDHEAGAFQIKRRLQAEPEPALLVAENCKECIHELRRARIKETEDGSFKLLKEASPNARNEVIDALRYGVFSRPWAYVPKRDQIRHKPWQAGWAPPFEWFESRSGTSAPPMGQYS